MRELEDRVLDKIDRDERLQSFFSALTGQEALVLILWAYGWTPKGISDHLDKNRNWAGDKIKCAKIKGVRKVN